MADPDHVFAMTPSGGQAHVVDIGRTSLLAQGTIGASDHKSLCGEVPARWKVLLAPPTNALDICQICARKALGHRARLDLPGDAAPLKIAAGRLDDLDADAIEARTGGRDG